MPVHDWTRVNAGVFHDFHHEWIAAIKHALNHGILPPDYYAMADQVAVPGNPNALGLQQSWRGQPGPSRAGGTALAAARKSDSTTGPRAAGARPAARNGWPSVTSPATGSSR